MNINYLSRMAEGHSSLNGHPLPPNAANQMMQAQALTTDEATPVSMVTVNGVVSQATYQPQVYPVQESPEKGQGSRRQPGMRPPPLPSYANEYGNRSGPITGKRVTSPSGGVQFTLDGGGSWSELARHDATLPTDANAAGDGKAEVSGGVFGFFSRKKGRGHSPKPKERGVLGKEGARVVIG
jgi:serine/threonine kinase 32